MKGRKMKSRKMRKRRRRMRMRTSIRMSMMAKNLGRFAKERW
jgi:hypothetical protein